MTEAKNHAEENAAAWLASILEMTEALKLAAADDRVREYDE